VPFEIIPARARAAGRLRRSQGEQRRARVLDWRAVGDQDALEAVELGPGAELRAYRAARLVQRSV